jgi:acyl-[acyl-carrier-protein]-phospholipid O-acyltransferase/long-chain-fatty-acid--[acyl-carrier-protein] ligase
MPRGFYALLWSQALGAFNDNAFKTLIALLAVSFLPADKAAGLIALAGALFVLPFILFSTIAGTVADRFSKSRLVVFFKGVEIVLMALTFGALYTYNVTYLMLLLVLMGAQSAFFGPVKLALLPEILDDKELSHGNGLMQMTTFGGILMGTVAAGLLVEKFRDQAHWAAFVFVAVAVAGWFASLYVSKVEPSGNSGAINWNVFQQTWRNLKEIRGHYGLFHAVMGAAFFWFLGGIFQMNILVYGKELMRVSEGSLSLFQVLVAVGIGAGSYLAGRLSRGRVELGLVPVAAVGLFLFAMDLAFSYRQTWRTMLDLFFLGASAGCFVVPLQAFIQQRAPASARGTFIATGNILSFSAVFIASLSMWAFTEMFRLHPGQIFLVVAVMTLVVAAYIVRMLPDFFMRMLLYPFAHLIYDIRTEGGEYVPKEGPALLVANHLSHVDPLFIAAAAQRPIRFLMFRPYYELPVVHWLFRMMKVIPISEGDSPREMVKSFETARQALRDGDLVCIFAEGAISRHGQMLRFKKGYEKIVKGVEVPIVPVHLDRVWGSIFSFERGRFLFKRPRRIPYPVTVSFGAQLPATTPAHELRQNILELASEAFKHRLEERQPLGTEFLREAKRHMGRFAMADSTGAQLSYGQALTRAHLLGLAIEEAVGSEEVVSVLLPPSAGAALTNIGLQMRGRVTANLNYTASPDVVQACASKANSAGIVTSRKFLQKLGWDETPDMVFIEDLAGNIPKPRAIWTALCMYVLPTSLLERWFLADANRSIERMASLIFTSGSTGTPKGVMLSHSNVLANIEALAQLYQVGPEDRIMGVLPFFHSFGHTVTLYFPLISGFGTVYHFNPLDAKRIGSLTKKFRATFLLGTPTFLSSYIRRVPAEDFSTLRYVVVGAEKLRADVAAAFAEKFSLHPLEGYGATELSPVASVNIPDFRGGGGRQKGEKLGTIGHPLPGVLIRVIDPDSEELLAQGEAGLMLVKGPNVMMGYLADEKRTAEVLRDGYYITGDIGKIDVDGFVTITDRLSRFSKIAGEMVPHIKIEEKLHELAATVEQTFVVAAVPDDKKGEKLIVLYKGISDVEALWRKLNESGLPKLWVPSRDAFFEVADFPLLGSGKLDMQALKNKAQECAQ